MSEQSANLALTFLAAAQAQKHVSVNESLLRLDALVQLSVVSATTSVQPSAPSDGQVYILPAGKTGAAWGAMADHALAYWRDGVWEQLTPREGWLAWIRDADLLVVYSGAGWSVSGLRAGLGLGSAALKATGASGDAVPLLNGANTWGANQTLAANLLVDATRVRDIGASATTLRYVHAAGVYCDQLTLDNAASAPSGNANERYWDFYAGGSTFQVRAVNDAYSSAATALSIVRSGATLSYLAFGASVRPSADNAYALGAASNRWSTVYAGTGAINTSDAREKTALQPVSEALKRAVKTVLAGVGVFQWLSSVAAKGADGARLHVGVTAQAVRNAFLAEGLDPERYGLFCADPLFETVETEPSRMETSEDGARSYVPSKSETRPVLDDNGAQMIRLGVRADQLLWLALAAV